MTSNTLPHQQDTLFDKFERTDKSPAAHEESSFAFMNRVRQPYWEHVRNKLEEWFSEYPAEDARDLAQRFRSDSESQHLAAWWELYVFKLFGSLGFQLQVHPELAGSTKRPDFLATRSDFEFYIEAATFFSGISDSSRNPKRDDWIYDIVNKLSNPNFFVGLELSKSGSERPSSSEITRPLATWLESLDPDVVAGDVEANGEYPELQLNVRDWALTFSAIPISVEHRGKPGRLLGVYPGIAGFVNDKEVAHKTLNKKSSKYGQLDKPLLVAVYSPSPFIDDDDIASVLFGNVAYSFIENGPPNQEIKPYRLKDGLWAPSGSRRTRVSAVLVGAGLTPWNPAQALPRLWLNPWAARPLGEQNFPFPVSTSDDTGAVSHFPSDTAAEIILGLPAGWLGSLDPFEE